MSERFFPFCGHGLPFNARDLFSHSDKRPLLDWVNVNAEYPHFIITQVILSPVSPEDGTKDLVNIFFVKRDSSLPPSLKELWRTSCSE